MSPHLTKYDARKFAREILKQIPPDSPLQRRIKEHLGCYLRETLLPGSRLLAFFPLSDEIDVLEILQEFSNPIYLPRTEGAGMMDFGLYMQNSEIIFDQATGHGGIPGAGKGAPPLKTPLQNTDIVLIPSLGCNSGGFRLGRGGGYYDRRKNDLILARKITLLPEVLANLEFLEESHDLKLDLIITEAGKSERE